MFRYNTPLRYPGGKQKLAPFVAELLEINGLLGCHYVEPYAGGAGVAIQLLMSGRVEHIHLNDSCFGVFSFWKSVLSRTDDLCRRISGVRLTIGEWRRQKEILARSNEFDQLDVGFSLFFLNRCNRSGIVSSGGVIGGLKQTGKWKMNARFPKKELIRRIEAIAAKRRHITVKNLDAEIFTLTQIPSLPKKTFVYCDPPYYHKADRLYLNHYSHRDHTGVAYVIQRKLQRPWLVSYDNSPEILKCFAPTPAVAYDLQYHAATAYKGSEVLFFSEGLRLPKSSSVACVDIALRAAI